MLQKCFFLLLFSFSAAAFAENTSTSGQISTPKYKISDTDLKIWIRQTNNAEQCIFPELANEDHEKIYEKWTIPERLTMTNISKMLLIELVGEENYTTIDTDPASLDYLIQRHKQLNHQVANVNQEQCESFFKPRYYTLLERIENDLPKVYRFSE